MVGNHPLAITLLAASARKQNATPGEMLSQYKSRKISMLGPSGRDPHVNMGRCIQVSMDRLVGEFQVDSVHLLARLSMLPLGATMSSFWLEDLKDIISPALELLLDAALVQTQQTESGMQRYTIHPVIRDYILEKDRCPGDVLVRLLERAHTFLEVNEYNIGEVAFKERAAIVQTEETNLQAVLLIPSGEDLDDGLIDAHLNALLLLGKHHAATSPRLEVVEKAVSLAKSANKSLLQAEALFSKGKNLHLLDRYPEARDCFEAARELFKGESAGGQMTVSRAADCLLEVVYELTYITVESFSKKMEILDEAFTEYQSVSDEIGVGRCFRARGQTFSQTLQQEDALEVLQEANRLLVNSPYHLGLCYQFQAHANFAVGNFEEGDRYGPECGLLLGLAQSWSWMSLALIEMGNMDLAAKSIAEAQRFSMLLPDGLSKLTGLCECEELRARGRRRKGVRAFKCRTAGI